MAGSAAQLDLFRALGDAIMAMMPVDVLEGLCREYPIPPCTWMARSAASPHKRLAQKLSIATLSLCDGAPYLSINRVRARTIIGLTTVIGMDGVSSGDHFVACDLDPACADIKASNPSALVGQTFGD
jgi:hypothetical protein